MRLPTAEEQLYLELINRARSDPQGELDRLVIDRASATGVTGDITAALAFFAVDLDALDAALADAVAVAPLAWSTTLAVTARNHSGLMIEHETQAQTLPGQPTLRERLDASGYEGWLEASQSIFAHGGSIEHAHAAHFIDWGAGPGGMNAGAGNRERLLAAEMNEIGLGLLASAPGLRAVGPWVATQQMALRPEIPAALVGTVTDDLDGDDFYDIGEGLAGVTVRATGNAGSFETTTWESGGFRLDLPDGAYDLQVGGGALGGYFTGEIVMSGVNRQLDVRADEATAPADRFVFGAGDAAEDGGDNDDLVEVDGTPFNDTIVITGGSALVIASGGSDRVTTAEGGDTVFGGSGNDVIKTGDGADV
ncbi:MAG: CAP domain-containing protein, partial [Pseudomonadota bacterium]